MIENPMFSPFPKYNSLRLRYEVYIPCSYAANEICRSLLWFDKVYARTAVDYLLIIGMQLAQYPGGNFGPKSAPAHRP